MAAAAAKRICTDLPTPLMQNGQTFIYSVLDIMRQFGGMRAFLGCKSRIFLFYLLPVGSDSQYWIGVTHLEGMCRILSRYMNELSQQEMQDLIRDILNKRQGYLDKKWQEIVSDYDLCYAGEHLRKVSLGVQFAKDAGMKFDEQEKECIDKSYIERQKLYDVQKDIRKTMREMSRSELICEHITKAIKELPEIKLDYIQERVVEKCRRELVVNIGDFHYGAEYKIQGLYGETINEYNSGVFENRMARLAHEVSDIVKKENPEQITILIAGDMLDGLLRTSQLQRLEYGVIESTIRLSETLATWLTHLHNACQIPIRVYAVRGNHGEIRPLGSKAGQFPEENMERIVMFYLSARFSGYKTKIWIVDDAPMTQLINICGYQFLLTHGQGMSIESLARDSVNLYKTPIDVFVVGHLHKGQTFTSGIMPDSNISVERVPSLCGIDPYSQSLGYGALPGATVILMQENYGKKCVYPIILK